ncbi:MAG TPA: hypothetical protein DDX71_03940 [Ruminococcus sp.]|nr:hypothetical protein [Ruminococcus sp.]
MAKFCTCCGRIIPDLAMQCPQCGGMQPDTVIPQAPPVGTLTPFPEIQRVDPLPPVYGQQVNEVMTPFQWFGWVLVLVLLGIFGSFIMYNHVRDQSAKNLAKLLIVLHCIAIIFGMVGLFMLFLWKFLSIF